MFILCQSYPVIGPVDQGTGAVIAMEIKLASNSIILPLGDFLGRPLQEQT